MTAQTDTFVTPAWLATRLDQPNIVPVEASFFLPDEGKDADALFREGHIPGAVRFDVDAIADRSIDLPHMLPDDETFGRLVGALGIGDADEVVIYDGTDLLGGARAWWMFRHYGERPVRVLEGGYRAWLASGLPIETGPAKRRAQSYKARSGPNHVVGASDVLAACQTRTTQIVDARAANRFEGSVPEPRAGLRSGHMPDARNLPWRKLVDQSGRLREPDALLQAFKEAGVDISQPIITTCGSGVSAAILLLGLEQLGIIDAALYDGSWSEWGGRADLPVETGPARGGKASKGSSPDGTAGASARATA